MVMLRRICFWLRILWTILPNNVFSSKLGDRKLSKKWETPKDMVCLIGVLTLKKTLTSIYNRETILKRNSPKTSSKESCLHRIYNKSLLMKLTSMLLRSIQSTRHKRQNWKMIWTPRPLNCLRETIFTKRTNCRFHHLT